MGGLILKDVLHKVVYESPYHDMTARQLAEELGMSYSMLCNAANPELDEFKFAARYIIPTTRLTGDYRLLDFMEGSCNRVAFSLPNLPKDPASVDKLIAENVQQFGQALGHIGEGLKDGVIDDIELKRIELSLLEQVRTSMSLLQQLKNQEVAA